MLFSFSSVVFGSMSLKDSVLFNHKENRKFSLLLIIFAKDLFRLV
jgi:hypothetical protein